MPKNSYITPDEAQTHYRNDSAHDFDHVRRVWANAQKIAQTEPGIDMAVLQAATLLHDIARADQRETGVEHAAEGARRARQILRHAPAGFVEAVCHAIAAHRFRVDNPPQTLEAKILYDADKLDAIGAVGVARAFAFSGAVGQRLWAEDAEGVHTALQEFEQKLSKIQNKLITNSAKVIAKQRHEFMCAFFAQLAAEIYGER